MKLHISGQKPRVKLTDLPTDKPWKKQFALPIWKEDPGCTFLNKLVTYIVTTTDL